MKNSFISVIYVCVFGLHKIGLNKAFLGCVASSFALKSGRYLLPIICVAFETPRLCDLDAE